MISSCADWKNSRFRALYIEEAALDYPLSDAIRQLISSCPVIFCRSYKEILNRPRQDIILQKSWPALILAVKKPPFIYPGAEPCQNFGYSQFLYANLATGCPFDCEYCFLQGLNSSGDIVIYVNTDDIFAAVKDAKSADSLYLALSHDSDLIALYNTIPQFILKMHIFSKDNPNITVEIRTKSAVARIYREINPLPNLIIGFTLSPQPVIERYENKTPSLQARLKAVSEAVEQGFKVRLCFDPVFINDTVDSFYERFFDEVFSKLDPTQIHDVSYGFFRLTNEHFRRIRKNRPCASFLSESLVDEDRLITYEAPQRQKTAAKHLEQIGRYINSQKIYTLD